MQLPVAISGESHIQNKEQTLQTVQQGCLIAQDNAFLLGVSEAKQVGHVRRLFELKRRVLAYSWYSPYCECFSLDSVYMLLKNATQKLSLELYPLL